MRDADLRRLQEPFAADDRRPPQDQYHDALQLNVPAARQLVREIHSDLSPDTFGIGWWRDHTDPRRRILVSDQLALSVTGIEVNLAEARLHYFEVIDLLEQIARRPNLEATRLPNGELDTNLRRKQCAAEFLVSEQATLHIVGFFRAVGSALDCLGASIIGVAGLKTPILSAGFSDATGAFRNISPQATAGLDEQRALCRAVTESIDAVGPAGWLLWATNYRNMTVHRGRHLQMSLCRATGGIVALPSGGTYIGLEQHLLLTRDPSRGEVDAWRDDAQHTTLREDARETVCGIWESATAFIERCGVALLAVWLKRRAEPTLITQPVCSQWGNTNLPTPNPRFEGYAPSTESIFDNGRSMIASGEFTHRLNAAGLNGDGRARWAGFPPD